MPPTHASPRSHGRGILMFHPHDGTSSAGSSGILFTHASRLLHIIIKVVSSYRLTDYAPIGVIYVNGDSRQMASRTLTSRLQPIA